jgi:hypothetical protein
VANLRTGVLGEMVEIQTAADQRLSGCLRRPDLTGKSDAVRSSEQSVSLARVRYIEGLSNYNEVLEAQQRLYPAQVALAEAEISRRLVVVQLYSALGGGWNLTDPQWTEAAPLPTPAGRK